jgi:hypothetical protein
MFSFWPHRFPDHVQFLAAISQQARTGSKFPCAKSQAPKTICQKSARDENKGDGANRPQDEIWNLESAIRNLESEILDLKSAICDPESGV